MKKAVAMMMGLALLAPTYCIAAEPLAATDLLGCWSYSHSDEKGFDYTSLCFVEGGLVETATGGGPAKGGLSATSSGGSYAIEGSQISFVAVDAGYGWLWDQADVTCRADMSDASHLALTACGGGAADQHFEREVVAEEVAD